MRIRRIGQQIHRALFSFDYIIRFIYHIITVIEVYACRSKTIRKRKLDEGTVRHIGQLGRYIVAFAERPHFKRVRILGVYIAKGFLRLKNCVE